MTKPLIINNLTINVYNISSDTNKDTVLKRNKAKYLIPQRILADALTQEERLANCVNFRSIVLNASEH